MVRLKAGEDYETLRSNFKMPFWGLHDPGTHGIVFAGMNRHHITTTLLMFLLMTVVPACLHARSKTDLVYLNNGDRITGEIKQMDRGILQLKTDGLSTVNIEWADIDSVNSVYQFRVEDRAGDKYFGSLFLRRDRKMEVIREGLTRTVAKDSVVTITPLEASFWQQLDGSIGIGFSYTKSDALSQLNVNGWVMRRNVLNQTRLDFSTITKKSSATDRTVRYTATLQQRRLLKHILFAEGNIGGERNDELNLDLRLSLSAALGANIVKSNRTLFVSSAGLTVNREFDADGTEKTNIEGLISAEHEIFAYNFPKVDYSLDATLYPSFNDWGRVRFNMDFHLRREVVKDFFLEGTFYLSSDNRPPAGGSKRDYGITFNLSWTF